MFLGQDIFQKLAKTMESWSIPKILIWPIVKVLQSLHKIWAEVTKLPKGLLKLGKHLWKGISKLQTRLWTNLKSSLEFVPGLIVLTPLLIPLIPIVLPLYLIWLIFL